MKRARSRRLLKCGADVLQVYDKRIEPAEHFTRRLPARSVEAVDRNTQARMPESLTQSYCPVSARGNRAKDQRTRGGKGLR
jgi:hypothetical protein